MDQWMFWDKEIEERDEEAGMRSAYTWQIIGYIIGHVICLILLCYLRSCRRTPSLLASLLVSECNVF